MICVLRLPSKMKVVTVAIIIADLNKHQCTHARMHTRTHTHTHTHTTNTQTPLNAAFTIANSHGE